MAVENVRKIIRVKGSLIKDPTNIATDTTFGGTILGTVKLIVFNTNIKHMDIMAEEFGERVETLVVAETAILATTVRGLDNDMISLIFQNTTAGASSGDRIIDAPSSSNKGALVSARAFKLLFAPKNTKQHPFLIFYNALPLVTEAAAINFSPDVGYEIPVMFQAIRDSSSRLWQQAKREDITL